MNLDLSTLSNEQLQDYDARMREVAAKLAAPTGLASTIWTAVLDMMTARGVPSKPLTSNAAPAAPAVDISTVSTDDLKAYDTMMHDSHAKIASFSSLALTVWADVQHEMITRGNSTGANTVANTVAQALAHGANVSHTHVVEPFHPHSNAVHDVSPHMPPHEGHH